jgi:hypothetical protein
VFRVANIDYFVIASEPVAINDLKPSPASHLFPHCVFKKCDNTAFFMMSFMAVAKELS